MTYLMHVTLDTGHGRRSYRDEVADPVVTILAQDLAEALAQGMCFPVRPGYATEPNTVGSALLATVTRTADAQPLATIAVARKSRDSARLWSLLVERFGAVGVAPSVPWCAVKLHPALAGDPEATRWLGDYERCLAWAWLEQRR